MVKDMVLPFFLFIHSLCISNFDSRFILIELADDHYIPYFIYQNNAINYR